MLFLFASALLAVEPGGATPVATPPAKPVKEKKICRSDTGTGSIMPKTTCKTQAEWNALGGATSSGAVEDMKREQMMVQTGQNGRQ